MRIERFLLIKMNIPQYRLQAILTRLDRIAVYAKCDYRDLRTTNALRLLKSDIAYIRKQTDKDES